MTEIRWFYVDAQQQKVGPVPASAIKDAYQRGELRADTLVWHAELLQWQSLASHADKLAINLSREIATLANGREVKYANFFHRWAALVIDQWLLSLSALVLVFAIAAAVYFLAGFSFEKKPDAAAMLIVASIFLYLLMYIVMSGSYHVHFETSARQGSWGKQYLGLIVSTDQGERLDRRTAALRWLSAALSHLSQNIGFLMAAFTQKRQALHDFLASTLVLERDTASSTVCIDRNKRSLIVLIFGVLLMPMVLTAMLLVPMFYFIEKREQAERAEHQKIAALVVPIQDLIRQRVAKDQTCLGKEDPNIASLLLPLKPLVVEAYVGVSEDEQACEIYLTLANNRYLDYRYTGEGSWSCEASYQAEHFGKNCQLADY